MIDLMSDVVLGPLGQMAAAVAATWCGARIARATLRGVDIR